MCRNLALKVSYLFYPGAGETETFQTVLNIRDIHEEPPEEPGTIVLDHGNDGAFIDGQMGLPPPVMRLAETVGESIRSPDTVTEIIIKMPQRLHTVSGGIREGG